MLQYTFPLPISSLTCAAWHYIFAAVHQQPAGIATEVRMCVRELPSGMFATHEARSHLAAQDVVDGTHWSCYSCHAPGDVDCCETSASDSLPGQ